MKAKYLTRNDYFEHFKLNERETGAGVEMENGSRELYFLVQTFLPWSFFEAEISQFSMYQLTQLPERIQLKLELFATGSVDNREAFVFKPWILDIDDHLILQALESFHLFIPDQLFYNLIHRLIFLEQIKPDILNSVRVIQDLPSGKLEKFGLDCLGVDTTIETEKLIITRLQKVDDDAIKSFYTNNWESISSNLERKYFHPRLNAWFKISKLEETSSWFGIKKSQYERTIGFCRLYTANNSFSGGMAIEYIIDKNHRRKGYAKEACHAIIHYAIENSHAMSIRAEVNNDNEASANLLLGLGFEPKKTGGFDNENFVFSLSDYLADCEVRFSMGTAIVSIKNKYAEKYARYFY